VLDSIMRWPGAGRKAAHRRTQSYESDISLDPEDDLPPPSRTPLPKGQIFVLVLDLLYQGRIRADARYR
jgi:hypothetical protein